jgi:APA family basic amino acid/polyamine antiporter
MDPSLPPPTQKAQEPTLVRGLSLLDSVLLLVGGVIGSGIFLTSGQIADEVRYPAVFFLVWIAGGVISLLACFAFAELGAMFPEAGGQYIYLREAYGEFPGFLYGWMMFAVGNTGGIATLAVGFAEYFGKFLPWADAHRAVLATPFFTLTRGHLVALTGIASLTVVNILGLRRGATLQNVATFMKFAAIAVFVGLGLLVGKGSWGHYSMPASAAPGPLLPAIGVALIAVFWTYDGWVYVTWAAGEIKNPQRDLPRTMVIGMLLVMAVYAAMNLVYLYALPMDSMAKELTIAQAAAVTLFSPGAAHWLAAMIAVSCFGAMCSAILSGARIYYAMAHDGVFFRRLAHVHPRWRTPVASLVIQGVWASVLALSGRYDQLFTYSMFAMVASYAAGVAALFVLRWKRPDAPRPYRCTGYPWLPALYVLVAGAWGLNALWQRPRESLAGAVIILLGVPGYLYWRRRGKAADAVR